MTIETDLPCSDCGTDLRERTLPTSELSLTDEVLSLANEKSSPTDEELLLTDAKSSPTDAKPSPTDAEYRRVTVADCPACGARYFPADALARLAAPTGPRPTEEGS